MGVDVKVAGSMNRLAQRQQVRMPFTSLNPGLWDDELDIVYDSHGEPTHAVVPKWAVDEQAKTVMGQAVAVVEDYVMVVLPPGSMGGGVALVPNSRLTLDEVK